MANVQNQFIDFDSRIKLRRYKENSTLAEKRKRVLDAVAAGIKKQRDEGTAIPIYRDFNQGSYDVGVGVKPLDSDYDIDVGLAFDLAKDDYPDPVVVKKWVFDAVDGHTKKVELRGPCVTVFYEIAGEPVYHVDLAIYADRDKNAGKLYLARGKLKSATESKSWDSSDPEGLTSSLNSRFSGDDGRQFRRGIRAMKRWKDERFSNDGACAPRGIALAVAAYNWFSPATRTVDGEVQYDDLQAVRNLVGAMLARFSPRLIVNCPADPFDDLYSRMTDIQMGEFKAKLQALYEALREAAEDTDPHTACKTLARHFGSDFHIPAKEETAKPQRKAITSSGNSG